MTTSIQWVDRNAGVSITTATGKGAPVYILGVGGTSVIMRFADPTLAQGAAQGVARAINASGNPRDFKARRDAALASLRTVAKGSQGSFWNPVGGSGDVRNAPPGVPLALAPDRIEPVAAPIARPLQLPATSPWPARRVLTVAGAAAAGFAVLRAVFRRL